MSGRPISAGEPNQNGGGVGPWSMSGRGILGSTISMGKGPESGKQRAVWGAAMSPAWVEQMVCGGNREK